MQLIKCFLLTYVKKEDFQNVQDAHEVQTKVAFGHAYLSFEKHANPILC